MRHTSTLPSGTIRLTPAGPTGFATGVGGDRQPRDSRRAPEAQAGRRVGRRHRLERSRCRAGRPRRTAGHGRAGRDGAGADGGRAGRGRPLRLLAPAGRALRPAPRRGRIRVVPDHPRGVRQRRRLQHRARLGVVRGGGPRLPDAVLPVRAADRQGRPVAGRRRRLLVATLYLPTALLMDGYPVPSPYASCDAACPPNAFQVVGSEPAFVDSVLVPLRELLTILLYTAVTFRLGLRVRRASPLMRQTLSPVLLVATARVTAVRDHPGVRRVDPASPVLEPLVWALALALPAMALAFLVGLAALAVLPVRRAGGPRPEAPQEPHLGGPAQCAGRGVRRPLPEARLPRRGHRRLDRRRGEGGRAALRPDSGRAPR